MTSLAPRARIVQPTPEGIGEAVALLRAGQVVGMPTETVYGLAGNAFDEEAVARIFAAKERPTFDPLIVHLADFRRQGLDPEAGVVDPDRLDAAALGVVEALAAAFWPGPLTLVLPRSARVPELVTSGLDTVGVRLPAHPVARALLEAAGLPLAAPSANRFGRISPTRARDVVEELGDRIPLVLDGGEAGVGVESTVVRVEAGGVLRLLRPGGIPVEALEEVTGKQVVREAEEGGWARSAPRGSASPPVPLAPGMLESHYAPSVPVILLPRPLAPGGEGAGGHPLPSLPPLPEVVALLLQYGDGEREARAGRWLSEVAGNRVVAARALSLRAEDDAGRARALFRVLRELDGASESHGVQAIVAEPAEGEVGLLHAINDRLRRAAAPRPGAAG